MKYKELIDALTPYAEEEVDALINEYSNEVDFWAGGGEIEIITIVGHE